ncbi:MAG: Gfo/Idh/MocA family oxidoreductase [Thermoguttaceae bacterium]|jgi:predicted dehydrogenase|nr:Gfo/Idh/MocA family oxidoreductase [Thermoguttaceae bacterium]
MSRIARRDLFKSTLTAAGAVAAATLVPRHVLGGPRQIPPSEKMNIAGVGVGGMGAANLAQLESENIVALCDVDLDYAAHTIKKYPKAKVYVDFREMLDRQKDIDGVVVATPDHTHAVVSAAAMRSGKHVYCQKPLTHDVYEARMLAKIANETKVATQMGIQGHSMEGIRLITEWVAAGVIGQVREVDAWCSLTYYPWGHAGWSSSWSERPKETPPVPPKLQWDLWIGPAPMRPYHRAYHPLTWRCWWDFGCGMMGDRGAHTLDPVVTALKLGPPTSVDATSCGNTAEVHPLSAIVTFQFPAREGFPPLKLTWYEGTRPPRPAELEDGRQWPAEGGVLIKGTQGIIMAGVYGDSPRIIPESKMREAKLPEKTIPRVKGSHEMDWVRACKTGQPAGADFAYAGPLTETCLLGNIAKRVDARIEWDSANLKITNLPDANKHVRTEYRKGWEL